MTEELKPCPFCGGDEIADEGGYAGDTRYKSCGDCGGAVESKWWNTRADSQELDAERAKVNALEAQVAVMREALLAKNYTYNAVCEMYSIDKRTRKKQEKALSLTPSEAAEMVRKKDRLCSDLLKALLRAHEEIKLLTPKNEDEYNDTQANAAIEEARAAGVEG